MQLSVIIVSYNVKYYLDQCLYSLSKALSGIEAEVIVFDNHSRDGSVDYLSSLYPWVTFIKNNHNLGFARGNNHAIQQSKGKYVLLLNPDTIVGENTLRQAVAFMDSHTKAGAAGVRMMKTDGSDALESRRGVPSPLTSFYKMTGLCAHFPSNHKFGRYYMGWLPWGSASQIDIVSGAFCLLRREALDKVGLLDEDYFMYGEDIDLSYRLLKGGWQNWYLPLRILHYKGESTQKSSFRYVHVFYEAMLIFFRKHYRHLSFLVALPVQLAIYGKASLALISMTMAKLRRSLGFVSSKSTDTLYIFYLSPDNMKRCQQFVRDKGLWAEFHDANKSRQETEIGNNDKQKAYIVYDMSSYTFNDILLRFSANRSSNLSLATYYPQRAMLITDSDIIV